MTASDFKYLLKMTVLGGGDLYCGTVILGNRRFLPFMFLFKISASAKSLIYPEDC
jgi:hypothetical protein